MTQPSPDQAAGRVALAAAQALACPGHRTGHLGARKADWARYVACGRPASIRIR